MSSPRLLIVTDDTSNGGTFRVATQLAVGLRNTFNVIFASGHKDENAPCLDVLRNASIKLAYINVQENNISRSTHAAREASQLVDKCIPDLIIFVDAAEIFSALALKSVARCRRIPYVIVINLFTLDTFARFSDIRDRAVESLNGAMTVVFVSEANKQIFNEAIHETSIRQIVIPNSCPEIYFEFRNDLKRDSLRMSLGISNSDLICLISARIEPRKGHALALQALRLLKERSNIESVYLALAGRGSDAHLRQQAKHLGILEKVRFLGERGDINDLLDASDLFILTSYAEGMPLCIIEALAKGVPVIASAVDGIPEQLDASCGVLLPSPRSNEDACVEMLAATLERLNGDRHALRAMGLAARSRALNVFKQETMIDRYVHVLTCALDQSSEANRTESEPIDGVFDLTVGDVLDFSREAQIWNYAGEGWSHAESNGMWTQGNSSCIKLKIQAETPKLRLMFDVAPFITQSWKTQHTDVFVNGKRAALWKFTEACPQKVGVDVDLGHSEVEIRMVHHRSTRPADQGLGPDTRQLALFVRQLEICKRPSLAALWQWLASMSPRFLI
jgi:glycosyltransferase involved in cell wall biosynthesis